MRRLRLVCVRMIQEDSKEGKGCEEYLRLNQDGKTPPCSRGREQSNVSWKGWCGSQLKNSLGEHKMEGFVPFPNNSPKSDGFYIYIFMFVSLRRNEKAHGCVRLVI